MKECLNYKHLDGSKLQCETCSHFCLIQEGGVGVCGIRKNIEGKLYLLTYGKAAAVNVDPIEKKPFFHFLPGSQAFSLGTLGCNLRCANCQNYDLSQMFGLKGKVREYEKLDWGQEFSPSEIIEQARQSHCASIAYTYNEPTIFVEYALDIMKLAHKRGLKNVWVSNGFMSQKTLDLVIPHLDAINVDIKSFEEKFYQVNCGARLGPILQNCKRLVKEKVWLEITTLIIPTLSDDEKMLQKLAIFIKNELGESVPWHLSAFSGAISWKLKNLPETPPQTIQKAYEIGKEAGLNYVYGGNVWGTDMENTYCLSCGKAVIERVGYQVTRYDKGGVCDCGKKLAGIF